MLHPRYLLILLFPAILFARDPNSPNTDNRPLRYQPESTDYVILNGAQRFNRPLYTAHTPGRIDAGDLPEFAVCTPTKGGILRLAFGGPKQFTWLDHAARIVARYRPGSEIYDIDDPALGHGFLRITALPTQQNLGLVLQFQAFGDTTSKELFWTYGGGTGEKSRTHFDLNDNSVMSQIWDPRPNDFANAKITLSPRDGSTRLPLFTYANAAGTASIQSPNATAWIADARNWNSHPDLSVSPTATLKLLAGKFTLATSAQYLCLQFSSPGKTPATQPTPAPQSEFSQSESYRQSVVDRITIDTPDAFINPVPAAISIAADDIWQPPTFMHGANAWRTPLLGWRGPYALDALSWHDRALVHLSHWASLQNTRDDFPTTAHANAAKNLAENDWVMLHSDGNIPQSHYDMNLAFIDALFRHLLWTGDLDFARKMWPVITRHLAWEKRCFDRGGIYEGYACIWASDGLEYNGGGATHSTSYNYYHNLMAARVARLINQNPAPYEAEAARIHAALQKNLWLPSVGWYAEYKDLLGLQRVHPDAALWTLYHAIDCQTPDPFQAYQCLRYIDTQIPHIPVESPSGPLYLLSSSNWTPYEWSLNNVCMGENSHTALAYWQSNQPDEAYSIFKAEILDAQFMGICPGDFPNLSYYDPNRGESYRDFGDAVGITSRALIEGLFGIQPDALEHQLTLHPGFPSAWNHASIKTPDLAYAFSREKNSDRYTIAQYFPAPLAIHLIIPAQSDHPEVKVDNHPAHWKNIDSSVGSPYIEIQAPAESQTTVSITWNGQPPAPIAPEITTAQLLPPAGEIYDPQHLFSAGATGIPPGHHTFFSHVVQSQLSWWQPINIQIPAALSPPAQTPASAPQKSLEMIDLTRYFNDKVTQIFKNKYLSPRTPYCSLQIPTQGIGNWTSFNQTARIDDTGIRQAASPTGILILPTGLPFKTPSDPNANNIAFTSQWNNYPKQITVPLAGTARHAYLLLAGSTNPMETHIDNGEILLTFADNSTQRIALINPTNWPPIEQDYAVNDTTPRGNSGISRLTLATAQLYTPHGFSRPPGGAATLLDFPIQSAKPLKSLTVHTLSNTVVIGLMSLTLER